MTVVQYCITKQVLGNSAPNNKTEWMKWCTPPLTPVQNKTKVGVFPFLSAGWPLTPQHTRIPLKILDGTDVFYSTGWTDREGY